VGWFAGSAWTNNSKLYTELRKLLRNFYVTRTYYKRGRGPLNKNLAGRGLRSIFDLTAVYSWQIHWDSIWIYNYLHLKELEILIKIVYYFQYDKTGLTTFSSSGPDMVHPITKAEFVKARILVAEGKDGFLIRKASVNLLKRAVANGRQKVVLQHEAWAKG
jgi:hypothetical protein